MSGPAVAERALGGVASSRLSLSKTPRRCLAVPGARPVAAEGRWPADERLVIVEFPTMDQLRTWYSSPEYARALAIRPDALERRLLFIDGA